MQALCHPATSPGMRELWRKRWRREKEKPPAAETQRPHLSGCARAGVGTHPRAGGRRGWCPSASAFLSRQQRDDGKLVVAPQGRDGSDPSAENGMGSFGVWHPALPGVLTDLGAR